MQLRINSVTIPKPTVAFMLWAVGLFFSVLLLNSRIAPADEQETAPYLNKRP